VLGGKAKTRLQLIADQQAGVPITGIRWPGGMIAFDVVTATGSPDAATAKSLTRTALQEGLILLTCGVHGNTISLLFPLIITNTVFAEALDVLERCLRRANST
jgi:4-aminobutyrate aminotransferase/(S)-3-amino-2-methylpropionate transaminase